MRLTIIDEFGKFLAHLVSRMKPRQVHIAIQICSGRTRMYAENLHRNVILLKFRK